MIKSFLVSPLIVGLALVGFQQRADPEFDAKVARPAYAATHPKVLIDEAHKNFHTAGRGYKPFADLLTNDGYQVLPNKEKFQESALKGVDVLVIANALGAAIFHPDAGKPAFTDAECDAVRDWVRDGGALLLGADNEILASRFGVDMSKVHTHDTAHPDPTYPDNPGWIVYSR